MLRMPELIRTRGHIAISILEKRLPERLRAKHMRITAALTGLVCAAAASMIWVESTRQGRSGTTTTVGIRIPRVWISAFICYGYTSTALYYLRGAAMPGSLPWDAAPAGAQEAM